MVLSLGESLSVPIYLTLLISLKGGTALSTPLVLSITQACHCLTRTWYGTDAKTSDTSSKDTLGPVPRVNIPSLHHGTSHLSRQHCVCINSLV